MLLTMISTLAYYDLSEITTNNQSKGVLSSMFCLLCSTNLTGCWQARNRRTIRREWVPRATQSPSDTYDRSSSGTFSGKGINLLLPATSFEEKSVHLVPIGNHHFHLSIHTWVYRNTYKLS